MPTAQKAAEIDLLVERFERSQMTILADYRGLSVTQMQDLRSKLRPVDSEFRVTKNTQTARLWFASFTIQTVA